MSAAIRIARPRSLRGSALAVVIALLAPVIAACSSGAAGPAAPLTELTGEAPDLSGALLGGGTFDASVLEGSVIVVNFWATWCGPCRREQPMLTSLESALRDRGVRFVGVNYRDDGAAAISYLEEFSVAYPSLADPDGGVAFLFEVPFLPTTIVIDAEGQLRFRVVGEIDRETLADLIARAGGPEID